MIELLHTDCMTYMATLPDAAFDLAIVDPPYGRGEDGGTNRCGNVKQKNGTVLRCLDGGYAKKEWDREPPPPEYFAELRRVAQAPDCLGRELHAGEAARRRDCLGQGK